MTDVVLLVILAVVNVPIYRAAFRKIFGSWENLEDAAAVGTADARTPFWGYTASFTDVYNNDEAKFFLLLLAAICIGAVAGEYYLICRLLHHAPFWQS